MGEPLVRQHASWPLQLSLTPLEDKMLGTKSTMTCGSFDPVGMTATRAGRHAAFESRCPLRRSRAPAAARSTFDSEVSGDSRETRGAMQRHVIYRSALVAIAALILGGCETVTDPITGIRPDARLQLQPEATAVELSDALATAHWNGVALEMIPHLRLSPVEVTRALAYLSLAQYNAVVAAEGSTTRGIHASEQAAVGGASVVVLSYIFPTEVARLEAELHALEAGPQPPGESQTSFAAGVLIGRAIGSEVVARARTDRYDAVWHGVVPTGAGIWISSPQPPGGTQIGQVRPFFLESADQFRPLHPPAFGSPVFLAALAEVRHIADTRTAEQDRIAKLWELGRGTVSPTGYFNAVATSLARRYRFSERSTAHALALANMAGMDAYIGCFEAKYLWWYLRPVHADPAITLAITMANHPAYPSGHSCTTAATAVVLGAFFPAEAETLRATVTEIGLSRIYAGVHYWFDIEAGNDLGAAVARYALAHDVHDGQPFALR